MRDSVWTRRLCPEPLDLVWTSQNYHDMHNPGRNLDINAANKAVYGALKPGGILALEQHRANPGPQDPKAANGYVTEAFVIEQAKREPRTTT